GRLRGDRPVGWCLSLDIAVDPRPEGRGSVRDLRGGLAEALPLVGGEAGPLEPDPLAATIDGESLFDDPPPDDDRVWDDGPARSTGWGARVVAAAGSAALTAAALTWLGPAPVVRPGVVAAAAAAAALLLPRLAWLAAAGP